MSKHLLAIDQGTTGSTALVLDRDGKTIGRTTTEFPQHFPQPGWVVARHGADLGERRHLRGRRAAQRGGARRGHRGHRHHQPARDDGGLGPKDAASPSICAIVWQCRRTADVCDALKKDARTVARVRDKTGLVIDAYFSATKIAWLLDHNEGARERADAGRARLRHHRQRGSSSELDGGAGARHRRDQRVAHAAHEPRPLRVGPRALVALRGPRERPARRSSAAPRRSVAPRACASFPTASPSPASRATSRRRSSARPASTRATRSAPTAPAPSPS